MLSCRTCPSCAADPLSHDARMFGTDADGDVIFMNCFALHHDNNPNAIANHMACLFERALLHYPAAPGSTELRRRYPEGQYDRVIIHQKSVVNVFSMLDDEDGGDYYNNLLNEHLPPGHYFWHDSPGFAQLQSFQADNVKSSRLTEEQIAARNNRLGLRPCALPGCSATEQFAKAFKVCSRCLAAAYCCAEHQAEHWKGHKKACKTPAQ